MSDWIVLNEGGVPFKNDAKRRQSASLTADGTTLNGTLRLSNDRKIEFFSDKARSNPKLYDAYWSGPKASTIQLIYAMPVFANEEMLRVGFLTAAYELWFKNFGYSWVLQSSLNIVREQILNPEKALISWNYLIETPAREILNPNIGLMRFGKMYFPIAQIYDQIIILPSATQVHPPNSGPDEMSMKQLNFSPVIDNRFQSRCAGPAVLTCDGQEIVSPDLVATPTIPLQIIRIDPWI